VFPYYWFTLKGTLWIVLVMYILAACTTSFVAGIVPSESGASVPEILKSPRFGLVVWGGITVMFGILTIGFAMLDRFQAQYHLLDKWNPRQLTPLRHVTAECLGKLISRPQAIPQLAIGVAFIVCWLKIPHFPIVLGSGAATFIKAGPAWPGFRLLLLAVVVVGTAYPGLCVVRPQWMRQLLPLIHGTRAAGLLWMFFLARSGNMVAVADTASRSPGVDPQYVVHVVNSAIAYGLLLGLCFAALNSGVAIARYLVRYIRQRGATAIHMANF
jgi:hypothetical protein